MKTTDQKIGRNVETGNTSVTRQTILAFRNAETLDEMVALAGSKEKAFEFFNSGRLSDLRGYISNTLAGKSDTAKNFDKLQKTYATMFADLSEEQIRNMILTIPGMSEKLSADSGVVDVPEKTDEKYWEDRRKKDEKGLLLPRPSLLN